MTTYKIIRFYRDDKPKKIVMTGLSLEEAQEECSKESSHKRDKNGIVWFEGYTKE